MTLSPPRRTRKGLLILTSLRLAAPLRKCASSSRKRPRAGPTSSRRPAFSRNKKPAKLSLLRPPEEGISFLAVLSPATRCPFAVRPKTGYALTVATECRGQRNVETSGFDYGCRLDAGQFTRFGSKLCR